MIQIPYTNQPTKSFLLVAQVEMYKHQVMYVGGKTTGQQKMYSY